MKSARYLFLALRPKQWTKNLLVYLALIFSVGESWQISDLRGAAVRFGLVSIAFVVFCMLSSAVYLFNDLADVEKDLQHPRKRQRPLAAGHLRATTAIVAALVLLGISLPTAFAINLALGVVGLGYLLLQGGYNLYFKKLVIIDVFALAAGFVLRAVAGGVAIGVPISPWLYICTTLLALFLGLVKRRAELVVLEENAASHRTSLEHYTPALLDQMIAVVTSSIVIAYGLYTFSAPNLPLNHAMMLTIPFVLYGVLRYLYLAHRYQLGGEPEEVLLADRPLLANIALWAVASLAILLFFR